MYIQYQYNLFCKRKHMFVNKFEMSNGDQIVSLVDGDCIPYAYPSYYITNELYLDNHSVNTMEKHVYELKFLLEWCLQSQRESIYLVDRVERGQFLSDSEVYQFVDDAKLRKEELHQGNITVIPLPSSDKLVSNAIASRRAAQQRVKPQTTNGRINTAIGYIEFLSQEIHTGIMPKAAIEKLDRTILLLKKSKLRISAQAASGTKYDGFNSIIPDDIFFQMLNIIAPDSAKNPFKHSRIRNRLIIEILASTGIRLGAVAKLKISDIVFTGDANRLYVRRSPEDPTDTRKNKPQQKTREHSTYIAPKLVSDLEAYISEIRTHMKNSQRHEFIFVSEMNTKGTQGEPLSLKSFEYLFTVLSKALGFTITPHMLRHKWNEIFTDKTGHLTDAEANKRRIDAMGWSKVSLMPERYNHFKNLQKAYDLQKEIQQQIFEKDNK